MSQERLTRHEISWLLAQEARGAAQALREGVTQLRQSPTITTEPRILSAPPVETTLDALDDAISMLSELNTATRGKTRRGRIDLAALLMDLAPTTRIAIEPGAGTEVFGDETDLRRMFNLLVTQAGSAQAGATAEVTVRRQGEWVKISVELGPDALGTAELERRWLSRMATRHGGWVELEGGTQAIFLPADGASDQREVVELRKELEQAQQLGEAYARELASVLSAGDIRTEPPPAPAPRAAAQRFETLQSAALGLQRSFRGLFEGLRVDAALAAAELGESSPLAQSLRARTSAGAELAADFALAADCPFDEAKSEVSLSELLHESANEADARRARHGVTVQVKTPASLSLSARPKTLRVLVRALFNHAISATPRDGHVVVSAYAVDGGILLSAEDGGPSVPEVSRVDLLRNRLDPTAFGRPSGIMLLIAEAAAESLGATLEVRDGPDGQPEVWTLLPR